MNDLDDLVQALTAVLEARGYRFTTGLPGLEVLPLWRVAQPDFLLPVLLRLAEEFWRSETRGAGFGLRIEPDDLSLTGFTATGLYHVPLSVALLAIDAVLCRMADAQGAVTFDALVSYAKKVTT